MSLSEHLRRYLETSEPAPAFLEAIRNLIRSALHRSAMWGQPPAYLGYPEYPSWKEAFAGEDLAVGPVGDFFLEKIAPEVGFLEETLAVGGSVEALLWQKAQYFLIDRQKDHDPIGYRVFKNLEAALEELVEAGKAAASNRVSDKLRNLTSIHFGEAGPTPAADERRLAEVIDSTASWQPVLRRIGKLGKGAQRLLKAQLEQLPDAGVTSFLVGEMAAVLKERVRSALALWSGEAHQVARADTEEDSRTEWIRIIQPDKSYSSSAEFFAALALQVAAAIDESRHSAKVRQGMQVVFADWLKHLEIGEKPPPLAEWALQLGMAKNTLHDYRKRIEDILRTVLQGRQEDARNG